MPSTSLLEMEIELGESDNTNDSSESTPKTDGGGLNLVPVSPEESGEGLPYAPINWPNPGDNWSWKVGRRVTNTGHFLDRYLCAPRHLPRLENEVLLKKRGAAFASKLSVERYIRTAFPGADINAFFASFSWKIPAVKNLSRGLSFWLSCLHGSLSFMVLYVKQLHYVSAELFFGSMFYNVMEV